MSGWAHAESDAADVYVDGRIWTEEVRRLCSLECVAHELPQDDREPRRTRPLLRMPCRKQLVAYLVHKHLFLSDKLVEDPLHEKWDSEFYDEWPVLDFKDMTLEEARALSNRRDSQATRAQRSKVSALLRNA